VAEGLAGHGVVLRDLARRQRQLGTVGAGVPCDAEALPCLLVARAPLEALVRAPRSPRWVGALFRCYLGCTCPFDLWLPTRTRAPLTLAPDLTSIPCWLGLTASIRSLCRCALPCSGCRCFCRCRCRRVSGGHGQAYHQLQSLRLQHQRVTSRLLRRPPLLPAAPLRGSTSSCTRRARPCVAQSWPQRPLLCRRSHLRVASCNVAAPWRWRWLCHCPGWQGTPAVCPRRM